MYEIKSKRWIKANKILFRFFGALSLAMAVLFFVFAVILYRGGRNVGISLAVAAFNLIAGIVILRKSW